MSYTPPGYPGQPQQPASPDGRWWWDGTRWRPNAANPFGPADPTRDDPHGPTRPPGGVRFTPGPPAVPNPYVPPRGADGTAPRLRRGEPVVDDLPLVLSSGRRHWWTPRRFVEALAAVAILVLVGISVLLWLSAEAYQHEREQSRPAATYGSTAPADGDTAPAYSDTAPAAGFSAETSA